MSLGAEVFRIVLTAQVIADGEQGVFIFVNPSDMPAGIGAFSAIDIQLAFIHFDCASIKAFSLHDVETVCNGKSLGAE